MTSKEYKPIHGGRPKQNPRSSLTGFDLTRYQQAEREADFARRFRLDQMSGGLTQRRTRSGGGPC